VPSGLAIYDTMQMMRCPIETVCVGMAYSMAAYLLASGTTGMRRIGDNARVLLHPTHVTYSGRLCDASGDIQNSKELTASLTEILVKHTKMELQRVCSVQEEDCYMSACDAEEIGLVDEIIEQKEEVNNG